ncbi:MAG: hypothetical protein ACI9JO_001691, partial [Psychrobacter okhotskensis]
SLKKSAKLTLAPTHKNTGSIYIKPERINTNGKAKLLKKEDKTGHIAKSTEEDLKL